MTVRGRPLMRLGLAEPVGVGVMPIPVAPAPAQSGIDERVRAPQSVASIVWGQRAPAIPHHLHIGVVVASHVTPSSVP